MSVSESQILNLVLGKRDYTILSDSLTSENFVEYKNEYEYIKEYHDEYKDVPSKEIFLEKFPQFKLYKVEEKKEPIIDRLNEENLFRKSVAVYNKASELISADSRKGIEYLKAELKKLDTAKSISCTGYNSSAKERLELWKNKMNSTDEAYIHLPPEFKELEVDVRGFRKDSELFLILGKSGLGKSQFLACCSAYSASQDMITGIISPEMNPTDLNIRIDTYNKKFSNRGIEDGDMVVGYEDYLNSISEEPDKLFISSINDFGGKITMAKVRQFCISKNLQALFIDGLTYIIPSYMDKGMSDNERQGQVATELLALSNELNIPVICAIQARRRSNEKKDSEGYGDSQSIYGSYMVAQVATRILSINKSDDSQAITLYLSKNRYGADNKSYIYLYDYDHLLFNYVPNLDDISQNEELKEDIQNFKEGAKGIF